MFIWKYENIAMFPTAVILKKHVENPRVFFFFFSPIKIISHMPQFVSGTVNT